MDSLGKILIFAGLATAAIGALLLLGSRLPWLRVGRLPGDVVVQREGFTLYVPLASMLLLSLVLTILFWAFARSRG